MAKKNRTSSSTSQKPFPCGRPAPVQVNQSIDADKLWLNAVTQLNAYCAEKKLNRSEAREKILETIIREARHFTALDLLERLQQRYPEIGKATMYRNLPVLVASGILEEGPHDPNGQVLYEIAGSDHHDHIVCLDCRRIFEFHDKTIEKRQDQVTEDLNFRPVKHRHVIFASCQYRENHQK